ncbi:ADP-ribosylation/Crystallin J1 [Xylariaceae sp. FL0804]|nr:ADP-ribosylation/Crystallin J1 [Xylariaceae sp. FL0804]
MASLPNDYLERVYAGVLGKIIGVYVGRPFEGWTHQRILRELGPVYHYVHDKFGQPLVVTDDDVSGTFTFVRALEEHGATEDLSAEQIGKTWLNNVIHRRSVFWWGGRGISTEHTAYLNLRDGIAAPRSGSMQTNGKTVAEQIGAQIFIDGWAMVAPGRPALAAKLAGAAASVSHDGEAVHAARLWAAMEAEAFVSKDVDHLLDVGLAYVPADSLIAAVIADVRGWCAADGIGVGGAGAGGDWKTTRQRIEHKYGYDKFCGICHVVPNHAIMIMALVCAGHDFHEAMHVVNTCGWDTDCNSGNVGCLVALMHGLAAFDGGPDWRGPLADRALVSSADGGYAVNDAARIALDVADLGRRLAGGGAGPAPPPPKDGAQFHFTLPGSVQGFQASSPGPAPHQQTPDLVVRVAQGRDVDGDDGRPGLAIRIAGLTTRDDAAAAERPVVEVLTPTFAPPEVRAMPPHYDLVGSPLLYPGQTVRALLRADAANTAPAAARLMFRAYAPSDNLEPAYGSGPVVLAPGAEATLEWTLPSGAELGCRPIQAVGVEISLPPQAPPQGQQGQGQGPGRHRLDGTVWLDHLRWDGTPRLTIKPSSHGNDSGYFFRRAFVNAVDDFHAWGGVLALAQERGEGLLAYGTRQWAGYAVAAVGFRVGLFGAGPVGVAARVRGLNRVALVKALDERRIELASRALDWELDEKRTLGIEVDGARIRGWVGDVGDGDGEGEGDGEVVELVAEDDQYASGGIGLVVTDGTISVESLQVGPLSAPRE